MAFHHIAFILIGASLASSAKADPLCHHHREISEEEVRRISDRQYSELLNKAYRNGHMFDSESVARGYERHFGELRLQFIDSGYLIIAERRDETDE